MVKKVEVSELVDVRRRFALLGLRFPKDFSLLPSNIRSAEQYEDLYYAEGTHAIRKIWRSSGILESRVEAEGKKIRFREDKSIQWVGPTIFIAASLISQNPDLIDVAMGLISSYLLVFFKGIPPNEQCITLNVIKETKPDGTLFKELSYEGSIEGLEELPKIIREM